MFTIDADLMGDSGRLSEVVDRLHSAWVGRTPVVIRLAVAGLAEPERSEAAPWELGGEFTFLRERLYHLVWANAYDGRRNPPVWWWGRKAEQVGASPSPVADITLPDGRPAWVDGGPRQPLQAAADRLIAEEVVHAETVTLGRLDPIPRSIAPVRAGLAPDQEEAVMHRAGAARVIAPAGSGKTRVLTARLLHLLDDVRIEPETVCAVAYNTRAAAELAERVGSGRAGLIRTIHSLGRAILLEAEGELRLLDEREVRRVLETMVPAVRRPNTDVIGPYLEGLSEIRIALRPPAGVEGARDDVPGLVDVFRRYRSRLHQMRGMDFDEQIYGAAVALLGDPGLRRRWQARCRHLLVDEFQDLTPAYLLLLRLVSSPGLEVFGVGDDDQVIYGYAGADPGFLIDFDRLFPGAGHHALEVNYRCPAPVVEAAATLMSYTDRRVDKTIRAGPDAVVDQSALDVIAVPAGEAADRVVDVVSGWLAGGETDVAVLCRVNSALLPVHAAMADRGFALRSPITPAVLERTVMAAALAWLRIGTDPTSITRSDLMAAVRRPSRGLAGIAGELLGGRKRFDLAELEVMARALDGRRRDRWEAFCADIALVGRACAGGDAITAMATLTVDVGLARAAAALDEGRTRADRSGQSDDLEALRRLAAHHRRLADFEAWLRGVAAVPPDPAGVLLTTVHRVKGLEWHRVVVYGADAGLMPHALSDDLDEERRVFHVAITRGRHQVVVVADERRPSRFLAEMAGSAPRVVDGARAGDAGAVTVSVGDEITVAGGWRGAVERVVPVGVMVALAPGPGRLTVRWGEPVTGPDGRAGPLRPGAVAADPALVERLKRWRSGVARAQRVPAYVVLTDATLAELAARRPRSEQELASVKGIGPAKLEAYGDDLLALVE